MTIEVREDTSAPAEFWIRAEPECDWENCTRPTVKALLVMVDGVFRAHVVACSAHVERIEAGRFGLSWGTNRRVMVIPPSRS